jgi:hypothetical protein
VIHRQGRQSARKTTGPLFLSFFGGEASAINLAVFRIAVFGWLLRVIYYVNFPGLVSVPVDLWVPPPGYDSLLWRIPIDLPHVIAARQVALVFCLMALVGLFTRMSALITCLCALYLLGLGELFGKIYHQYQHLVWFSMLLCAAPSGDALSIDALWAGWRRADRGDTTPPGPSLAYALPLRFVWLLIGVIYFFPGLAKLRAGPEWVLSDNLKYLMYSYWSRKHFVPWFRLDYYPFLYRSAALATIGFEVSFIACVFSRRLRPWAAAGGVIFHSLAATYLGLVFWSLVVCYTAFVDWAAFFARLGRVLFRRSADVFFDGRRAMHRRIVASLRLFDVFGRVRYIDTSHPDDIGREANAISEMHSPGEVIVGEQKLRGTRAYFSLLVRIPLVAPLCPLLYLAARRGHWGTRRADRDSLFGAAVQQGAATPPRRALSGVVVVGSALLIANIYCGVREIHSWPFTIYPQFGEVVHRTTRRSLEVVVRSARGELQPAEIYIPEGVEKRVVAADDGTRCTECLTGLRTLIQNRCGLKPGESAQVFEVERSVLPEERNSAPQRQELLLEVQAAR